ncbi:hypothetical protein BGZ81_011822 [Podila clonocystis]|nr:hypothetical protein BGZ81_011822 [Podila clonocystis]
MLVDISFLSIECLENLSQEISAGTFEIEKARSNLASKIIELGMTVIVFGLNFRKNVPYKNLAV